MTIGQLCTAGAILICYDEAMDSIGKGAQYKVIDTHDGRVRKIPLTLEESREVIAGWYAPRPIPVELTVSKYRQQAILSANKVGDLLGEHPELRASFGNPAFETEGVYTQDKLMTLGQALRAASDTNARQLIDAYARLIVRHWRYGISERVFNCTVNNGVDEKGEIVLLDFGEITSNKDKVIRAIQAKRWLRSYSFREDMSPMLQAYYADAMAERLTIPVLESTWRKAIDVKKP